MEERLKAGLWVKAQIRLCDLACIPVALRRKGDPDAGAVLLKLDRGPAGVEVLEQVRTATGALAWMRGTGPTPVTDDAAEAYLARQVKRDSDLWILEIEDPAGRYSLDHPIL